MQKNIDTRARRRREAIGSAIGGGLTMLLPGISLLLLLKFCPMPGGWSTLLLALAILNVLLLLPLFSSLRQRLKEIQGGEIDEASQY